MDVRVFVLSPYVHGHHREEFLQPFPTSEDHREIART